MNKEPISDKEERNKGRIIKQNNIHVSISKKKVISFRTLRIKILGFFFCYLISFFLIQPRKMLLTMVELCEIIYGLGWI